MIAFLWTITDNFNFTRAKYLNISQWTKKRINSVKTVCRLKRSDDDRLEYFSFYVILFLPAFTFFTPQNQLLDMTRFIEWLIVVSMRDGKNWIVSLCLNCDVQHIYIYILLLIDDWKIEKLELKIGVFDQNESEGNLPKEKVRFRSGAQTVQKSGGKKKEWYEVWRCFTCTIEVTRVALRLKIKIGIYWTAYSNRIFVEKDRIHFYLILASPTCTLGYLL